jgi:hypothetical protein
MLLRQSEGGDAFELIQQKNIYYREKEGKQKNHEGYPYFSIEGGKVIVNGTGDEKKK